MKAIVRGKVAISESMEKAKSVKAKSKIKPIESIARQGNLKKKKKGR